jgi:hypothetical protein
MAEYESFPLWRTDSGGYANVDPAELSISPDLVRQLLEWADAYDRTLNRNDPLVSGFPDPGAEEAFYARGEQLAHGLAAELGPSCDVEYFDGRHGHIVLIS